MENVSRRALLSALVGAGLGTYSGIQEAEARGAATFTVPKGKKQASLYWLDKSGDVKYSTNLDVQPGQKFRITTR